MGMVDPNPIIFGGFQSRDSLPDIRANSHIQLLHGTGIFTPHFYHKTTTTTTTTTHPQPTTTTTHPRDGKRPGTTKSA